MARLDGPSRDVCQHGSIDHKVGIAHKHDLDVVGMAKPAIQMLSGGDATEATAKDDDSFHGSPLSP